MIASAGRPHSPKSLKNLIVYGANHAGAVFLRKDEIARFGAQQGPQTIREGI